MKEKKRIAAGINWRRTITAPMMMKIHRAIPASLNEIPLAKAGVAIRVTRPTVKPANHDLFIFAIPHSPFLFGSTLLNAFHMPMGERRLPFIEAIEIIMLIKLRGIRLDIGRQAKSIIKIYNLANLIVKDLIIG